MAILPKSGKPTASQVVDWAKWMAKNHKGVDIDGRYGFQCWDLPNYIFQRYWHFRTWAMPTLWLTVVNIQIGHGKSIEIHLVSFLSLVI